MRVKIGSDTHHLVEVECDSTDLGYVLEKTQKVYEETRQPTKSGAGSYGFTLERKQPPEWEYADFDTEQLPVKVEVEK